MASRWTAIVQITLHLVACSKGKANIAMLLVSLSLSIWGDTKMFNSKKDHLLSLYVNIKGSLYRLSYFLCGNAHNITIYNGFEIIYILNTCFKFVDRSYQSLRNASFLVIENTFELVSVMSISDLFGCGLTSDIL